MFFWRKITCGLMFVFLFELISGCASQMAIPTRPGVSVSLLVAEPDSDPKGIFLLFPGGRGLMATRRGELRQNFPVVPGLFAEQGFVGAVVDVPSDQPNGFASGRIFRGSKEHAEDARKVIDFLTKKWPKPVFLLGHSSGGASVTHIALTLKDQRIKGIVLAGTGPGTIDNLKIPLEEVTVPVLRIKHRHDNCSSFDEALKQTTRFTKSPRVDFTEVLGGDRSLAIYCGGSVLNPATGQFEARGRQESYTHAFSGKEREVVKVVTDWAMGKEVPNRIGPKIQTLVSKTIHSSRILTGSNLPPEPPQFG